MPPIRRFKPNTLGRPLFESATEDERRALISACVAVMKRRQPAVKRWQPRRPIPRHDSGSAANGDDRPAPGVFDLTLLPAGGDRVMMLSKDVTLEANMIATLAESRTRYKDLVDCSSDFAWETDLDGRFVFVSPAGALGYAADELVSQNACDLLQTVAEDGAIDPFAAVDRIDGLEIWVTRKDGDLARLRVSCLPVVDRAGTRRGTRGLCRDVTVQYEQHRSLQRAERRARLENAIVDSFRREVRPEQVLQSAAEALAHSLQAETVAVFRCLPDGNLVPAGTVGIDRAAGDLGILQRLFAHAASLGRTTDMSAFTIEGAGPVLFVPCVHQGGATRGCGLGRACGSSELDR